MEDAKIKEVKHVSNVRGRWSIIFEEPPFDGNCKYLHVILEGRDGREIVLIKRTNHYPGL